MPQRFFVKVDEGTPDDARLDRATARHLRALRLRSGDEIVAIVGPGRERRATIVSLDESGARLRLGAVLPVPLADPAAPLVLAMALADAARCDLVIEKATELGATAIWPFVAERSQLRKLSPARRERWERIGRAASEQCGRTVPPVIESVETVTALCERLGPPRYCYVLTPSAAATAPQMLGPDAEIVLVIGPEGGLGAAEIEALQRSGAGLCSLGPRVLRFETAAFAGLVWASLCRLPVL